MVCFIPIYDRLLTGVPVFILFSDNIIYRNRAECLYMILLILFTICGLQNSCPARRPGSLNSFRTKHILYIVYIDSLLVGSRGPIRSGQIYIKKDIKSDRGGSVKNNFKIHIKTSGRGRGTIVTLL